MIEMLVDMPELCEGSLRYVKGYKVWTKTSPTLGWREAGESAKWAFQRDAFRSSMTGLPTLLTYSSSVNTPNSALD